MTMTPIDTKEKTAKADMLASCPRELTDVKPAIVAMMIPLKMRPNWGVANFLSTVVNRAGKSPSRDMT